MEEEIQKEPLSTNNPAFWQVVAEALQRKKELLVLQREEGSGWQIWYVIRSLEDLHQIIDPAKAKTSFSIMLQYDLFAQGIADTAMQKQVQERVQQGEEVFLYQIIPGQLEVEEWGFYDEDVFDLNNEFNKFLGKEVNIGLYPEWDKANSLRIVTAYVPDEDGVVRPGAY